MSEEPVWQLHEAKARFSEVFRRVRTEGPQRVVRHRGEAVIIVAAEAYERDMARADQPASLVDFFRDAPTGGRSLDISRKRDATRTIRW
ncbi:MAG: type II toxin-antitoxin system prevent-host-death family antitoxin [Acidobacteria bacterium]|nr:type II toxin-antitoxin system prevent-host-death family antitoxin [Acidobacteriota bacterium]